MTKRLLLVAFHFPPLQGSSGIHRTLSLARYLPRDGWEVTVLTVSPYAYRNIRQENLSLIPQDTHVIRVPAFDTARRLSVGGWHPGFLAFPDNFQSWIASAVPAGIINCRKHRPDIIFSTFPVASAHYIAWILSKIMKVPWVADFRDPMAQDAYPKNARKRRQFHQLERRFVHGARRVFVTTEGTQRLYRNRYQDLDARRFCVVPNGYDESMFRAHADRPAVRQKKGTTILHSGALYQNERDPSCLFAALAELKQEDPGLLTDVHIMFRGTRYVDYFKNLAAQHDLSSLVEFGDFVPYETAVSEMMSADALLLLQASNCNDQVPAKVYEYTRSGRPVIALTDPVGDTARLLTSCGISNIARLNETQSVKSLLKDFFRGNNEGLMVAPEIDVQQFSRKRIATDVARIFAQIGDQ